MEPARCAIALTTLGSHADLHRLAGLPGRLADHAVLRPQAWLTLRTRDVHGISAGMYSVFTVGVALWLTYGWRLGEWPIIIANAVTLVLSATILATKLVVERRSRSLPG